MMTSKLSKMLADNEKHKNNQVINRNISELWNGYKNFKAKFYAHNAELERFTLKVLKLSFFSNPQLKQCNNRLKSKYLKSRKINIKGQLALIKKAISIHLRSLQIEQRLFEENQSLKELLNHSYKIVIKEKNLSAIEIYEIKNVKVEEKCFRTGLEYIYHELEDVSNKTKLKTKHMLHAGNACNAGNDSIARYINDDAVTEKLERPQTLPHDNAAIIGVNNTGKKLNVIPEDVDPTEIDTGKPQTFNLQLDLEPLNSQFSVTVNNNLNSILQNISNQSLNTLVLDIKPVCAEAVLHIKDTRDKKEVVQKAEVASAKVRSIENESDIRIIDVREKADVKSLKNIGTLTPNNFLLNFIKLLFPLSVLFGKAIYYHDAPTRKKCDKLILQKEIACVKLQPTSNNIEFKNEFVTLENANLTCTGQGEGEGVSKDQCKECLNLNEIKTVEFYDIPSNTDIHDYTVSWVEQQNERDFHCIKQSEKMENDTNTNGQPKKRKGIMKRSVCSSRQDNFKDYLKNIITYSEEFYNKMGSSSTINSSTEKKRKRVINFPSSSSAESNYAGKHKTKNILEHNANSRNYKLPKMPQMNKAYQIVFQQNMPQGFSLKFVKSREKDVSTLVVSNRYPTSKSNFPKTSLYKK